MDRPSPGITPIATAADLGKAIHNERKRQGYTQAETAGLCGVGTTFLSDLENGKPTAELGKALFVARSLGIDLFAVKRGA